MIEVFKLDESAKLPTRNNPTDAGLDLYCLEDTVIYTNQTKIIKTGIAVNVPKGYVGKVEDRSGLASKGLIVGAGVIDAGYNGDVSVVMHNFSAITELMHNGDVAAIDTCYHFKKHDKIAQLLLYKIDTAPVWEIKELWHSARGKKGFGSSDGKKI